MKLKIQSKDQSQPPRSEDQDNNDTRTEQPEELLLRCPSCGNCLNFEVEIRLSESQEIIVEESSDCVQVKTSLSTPSPFPKYTS